VSTRYGPIYGAVQRRSRRVETSRSISDGLAVTIELALVRLHRAAEELVSGGVTQGEIAHGIFHVISWNMDFDGSITTYSGVRFWPLLPNPDDILIEDIAHSLSLQCRFAGHTRVFYSVAEHCVRVSQLCRPEDALWGLLHDASEAYLSDVPAPLKVLPEFEAYRAAEHALQQLIAVRFGLAPEQPASVTEADQAMLRIEMRDLLTAGSTGRKNAEQTLSITRPWSPRMAEARFLSRFHELYFEPETVLR
jgi:hypothetical protein